MTRPSPRHGPTGYRLRVAGHLDQYWSPWFGDLTLTHEDDMTTSLIGVVNDQAQLHGLLTKIRDLGVTLISVETLDPQRRVGGDADARHVHEDAAECRAVELTTVDDTRPRH